MKSSVKYIVYFVIGLALVLLVQVLIPKPIDWSKTFKTSDKIPYGLYILNKEISSIISPAEIEKYDKTPYEYYNQELDTVNFSKETWLLIEDENTDPESFQKIRNAVEQGHDVFLLTDESLSYSYYIVDSLGLSMDYERINTVKLVNPHLNTSNFTLETMGNVLRVKDSAGIEILGVANDTKPNFIRKKIGKGHLYIGTNALMLTNYHLLESNNHLYAESMLSYIDSEKVIWFDKNIQLNAENTNILRFILGNKSLRWAWYFMLIGILLFIFFNSKRKQRIIPIIKPEENHSVEFAKTIANLYYLEKNHGDLIHKMIIYLLEYVRTELRIDTRKLDEQFIKNLSQKTGSKTEDVEHLVTLIEQYKTQNKKATEQDVINLHAAIEKITGK
ncbi:DUF4350 domain-containing protein [Avrilella dinanensis]|uniref:DUF4350 domain-containing protein n=1 Tax=Avrilella dinanensis TaxID=2008672 RepID=UPI00240A94BF|nr:DUF4350 domain-containing protein [Avrilella dinanensis]